MPNPRSCSRCRSRHRRRRSVSVCAWSPARVSRPRGALQRVRPDRRYCLEHRLPSATGWQYCWTTAPIGRPIPRMQAYVLDATAVPIGVPGELVIGGAGVVSGWQRPGLSAEKFVPNPFADGMLYRTGGNRARLAHQWQSGISRTDRRSGQDSRSPALNSVKSKQHSLRIRWSKKRPSLRDRYTVPLIQPISMRARHCHQPTRPAYGSRTSRSRSIVRTRDSTSQAPARF